MIPYRWTFWGLVWLAVSLASLSALWAADDTVIPPELQRWQSWVLDGHEEKLCPANFNDGSNRRCHWPTRLDIRAQDDGGRFEQRWLVFARGWVPLPGGNGLWPEGVVVDGQPMAVVLRNGQPSVALFPGNHLIQGRFNWSRMPEVIRIPPASGLIALTVNGERMTAPSLDSRGRLWLRERASQTGEADRVSVKIFRLINDSIPMTVVTLVRLDISGLIREVDLGKVLLKHLVPMSLDSQLPARLDLDGSLFVQARPGRWEIRLTGRMPGNVAKMVLAGTEYGHEIWSFQPQNHLRMVEIEGVTRVEPSQTELPLEWHSFSAYQVAPQDTLTFKVLRRGNPDPPLAQLSLKRRWWLDFDGSGMTVQDHIRGRLSRQWHLVMNPPIVLGRVAVDGIDQVITSRQGDSKTGVELRRGILDLVSDARIPERSASMTAVGWDHDFQTVSLELHLPPGWRLFTASGVDQVSDTWLQRWSLMDFFLVLIIALSVLKLRGWRWGGLALVTMVLMFNEPGAPRVVWLHILAVLALLPLIPDGWIKRWVGFWGWAAMVALLVIAIPFMVNQILWGLFPQLAPHADVAGYRSEAAIGRTGTKTPLLGQIEERAAKAPSSRKGAKAMTAATPDLTLQDAVPKEASLLQDPDVLIPTGPGLPEWRWQTIHLRWHGPVARDQVVRLTLISPAANMALALLQVGLLGAMIWGVVDWRPWFHKIRQHIAAGLAVFFVLGGVYGADPAHAEEAGAGFPPLEMLEELRRRLLAPNDCLPRCADVSRLDLTFSGDRLQVLLKVHAAAQTAIPLPVNAKSWAPEAIFLDNAPIGGLARDNQGALWGMIPPGIHTVVMTGNTANFDLVQIPLPLKPHVVSLSTPDWVVKGINSQGDAGPSIQLIRKRIRTTPDGPRVRGQSVLPAFLHVRRELQLGLSWRVQTTIQRITPLGSPVVASVPLLNNESLLSPGFHVDDGQVLVNLSADQSQATFQSDLKITPRIELMAPRAVPWTETWILDASPIWHCDLQGISVIHHQGGAGTWRPQWKPWPGETVNIAVHRPKAIEGQSLTVQRADLLLRPGQRFGRGELTLEIKTSRGGQHTLELPPKTNLLGVQVNGKSLPIRQDNQWVTIPLQPGTQRISLQWHRLAPFAAFFKGPPVKVGEAAVNAAVTLKMPGKRWILLVGGPRWGPAVLFWGYLAVILLIAVGLGRLTTLTPVKPWQWALLGLGLTQVPAIVSIFVVGWLLALGARASRPMPGNRLMFNGLQVGLVVWSLVALVALFAAVQAGLIGHPDMQIEGNHSDTWTLNWNQDHIDGSLPQPWVLSLPLWSYRALMLAWSLWLAFTLLGWLQWGWRSFTKDGMWRKRQPKPNKKNRKQAAARE